MATIRSRKSGLLGSIRTAASIVKNGDANACAMKKSEAANIGHLTGGVALRIMVILIRFAIAWQFSPLRPPGWRPA